MDSGMLADIRTDATAELTDNGDGTTATVYSPNRVDDGMGGKTTDFTAGLTYPCVLQAGVRIPKETLQGEQITSMQDYTAKLPWNAVVSVVDRLLISGSFYEVLALNDGQTERFTLEINLKRPNQ